MFTPNAEIGGIKIQRLGCQVPNAACCFDIEADSLSHFETPPGSKLRAIYYSVCVRSIPRPLLLGSLTMIRT
jgi:hypothetical protein